MSNSNLSDTTDLNPYFGIAMGLFSDLSYITKYSTNEAVGTSWTDVWSNSAGSLTHLTTAYTVTATSSSANDTAAGSGAQTIRVEGLDENWTVATEDITMNGVSASSATTTTFIRVYRAYVLTTGTYGGRNAGTIDIKETNGSTIQAQIPLISTLGAGQTLMSQYTVPALKTGYVVGMHVDVASSKTVNVSVEFRLNADDVTTPYSPWRKALHIQGVSGSTSLLPPLPFIFPQKTDIRVLAKTDTGTAEIAFNYQLILADGVR